MDALCRKLIQVGGLYVGITMKPKISISLVIGDDQDDIWVGFSRRIGLTTGYQHGETCQKNDYLRTGVCHKGVLFYVETLHATSLLR